MSVFGNPDDSRDQPLAPTPPCPICGETLHPDTTLAAVRWRCRRGHSFANTRTLTDEIEAAAARAVMRPEPQPRRPRSPRHEESTDPVDWSERGDWDSGLVDAVMASQPWWRDQRPQAGESAVS